jgi:lysophospholipase L1-like esterase
VLLWEYRPHGRALTTATGAPGPGEEGAEKASPRAVELRTNRWGFRERDYAELARPEGVERIAFIGDSITVGLGVEEPHTFVRRIEAELGRRRGGRPVEALNFGIDGYNAIQIRELRAKALEHEPTLVVYELCLNDFDFEDASGQKILYFRKPRSFLLRTLSQLFARLGAAEYHHHHFEKNHARVFAELSAMRDLLRQRGIPLLVALVPIFEDFDASPTRDLHVRIDEFLDSEGIARVDLLPVFEQSGEKAGDISLDFWHPDARGHELIAEALSPRLEAMLDSGS